MKVSVLKTETETFERYMHFQAKSQSKAKQIDTINYVDLHCHICPHL